ncbi:hypothetical protein C1N73_33260 (plasmid) [Priestia aryabhattai]
MKKTICETNTSETNHQETSDIILAGSGIMGAMQMTRETEAKLKTCDIVYVLHYDNSLYKFVESLGVKTVDASEFYKDGQDRTEVYRRIADSIIQDAKIQQVGFLVHGHPLFIVSTSEYLIQEAKNSGLKLEILPAVSSLDTVITDLQLDLGYALQLYEANFMLNMNPKIDNKVPLLIFQVAVLGLFSVQKSYQDVDLHPLQEFLLKYYPATHVITFVLSSKHVLVSSDKLEVKVEELDKINVDFLEGRPTLYIPPIEGE